MNAAPLLLDTCALIWLGLGEDLSEAARDAMSKVSGDGAVFVSPITAWEIGLLVSLGRIALPTPPLLWFEGLLAEGLELAAMTPEILMASSSLPGELPKDPADRIIAATARHLGHRLVTRDRALQRYGEQGHVTVIVC